MSSSVASRAAMAAIGGLAQGLAPGGAGARGGFSGGDQAVGAGDGEVVLGQVAGVGQEQLDQAGQAAGVAGGLRAGGGGAVGGDERGGGLGPAQHGLERGGVGGVAGEVGGDDQPVFAADVLGVVALDEPAP